MRDWVIGIDIPAPAPAPPAPATDVEEAAAGKGNLKLGQTTIIIYTYQRYSSIPSHPFRLLPRR